MSDPSDKDRPTKAQGQAAVVSAIRAAIVAGNLAPGQRLVEADLCRLLDTSRNTLRAALNDLQHEGLVERIANRGARVRVVALEEALQVVEVRMRLELLCVERAVERFTDADVARLKDLRAALLLAGAENSRSDFSTLTNETFTLYVQAADHAVASEMLERLRDRMARHRLRLSHREGRAQTAVPFWIKIIDALIARDAVAATDAIVAHAQNVRENMIAISTDENPFASLK